MRRRNECPWLRGLLAVSTFLISTPNARAESPDFEVDPGPFPTLVSRVEPEYPATMWRGGRGDIVQVAFVVDSLGRVASADAHQGKPPFTVAALEAVRKWIYAPARQGARSVNSYDHVIFAFRPEYAVWSEEEQRVITAAPQPLIPLPFVCSQGSVQQVGSRDDYIELHVDELGTVRDVRFLGAAPPDSELVRRTAKRWIYRPLVSPDGVHAGRVIPFWTRIAVRRSCEPEGMKRFDGPDSLLLGSLASARTIRFSILRPATPSHSMIVSIRSEYWHSLEQPEQGPAPEKVMQSDVEWSRSVPADSLATALRRILSTGRRVRAESSPQLAEPRYAFSWFNPANSGQPNVNTILVNPSSSVLHVWAEGGLMTVAVQPNRKDLELLLRSVLPHAPVGPILD